MANEKDKQEMPDDLKRCVQFHGHICPGLIYGYRVAKEAMQLLNIARSVDEEVVAVSENDSCAVDALQTMLGTSAGKGNLIIQNYGKNVYTVISRTGRRAYRFSRTTRYEYAGEDKNEYDRLEAVLAAGTATENDRRKLKRLKIDDLLSRPFQTIFVTHPVPFEEMLYAAQAPSQPCAVCGEMTMVTKMKRSTRCGLVCVPCLDKALKGSPTADGL